jgi:hypothetical protein
MLKKTSVKGTLTFKNLAQYQIIQSTRPDLNFLTARSKSKLKLYSKEQTQMIFHFNVNRTPN